MPKTKKVTVVVEDEQQPQTIGRILDPLAIIIPMMMFKSSNYRVRDLDFLIQ